MTDSINHPLRALYPFRMKVHHERYTAREIVGPGGDFYDILVGWTDDDGSVVFNDIGGQGEPGWDPDKGHGSVWRYYRDGRLEPVVAPGDAGRNAFISIIRGEDHFLSRNDIFIVAQGAPGRAAASQPHVVLRVRKGANQAEIFATVPDAGTVNGGHAGAMMPDAIGPKGSPFEGYLLIHSIMNCTIYRIGRDGGVAEPFVTMMQDGASIMPHLVAFAPEWWGDLAGELIAYGASNSSFTTGMPSDSQRGHWKIAPDGSFSRLTEVPSPLNAKIAPAEFGPFGGHLFWAEEGDVDLAQISGCDMYADGLPYSGRIMHRGPDGINHVFADDFYGSYTSLAFDGDRLIVGQCGRSYSTGEFHEPDASLLEIRLQP